MKVIVGISGGVDSSVAALLLMQQGYDVEGLFMKNWEEDDDAEYCAAEVDLRDAKAVCEKLGIPLHAINFASEYWDNVFEHFLDEYKAGRTPNPDILCNTEIKFKAFLEHALDRGADFIATGHYVAKDQIAHDDGSTAYRLREAQDQNKDQTYFLHGLNQHQLKHSLFPLGDISKPEVRHIAEKHGLVTADKKDSTGICFIGERKFSDFLAQYLPAQPGNIETLDGEVIGRHNGLMYYTIGQRQGLGIGGLKHHPEEPWFSVEKDLARNVLIATQGHDHPSLLKQTLTLQSIHWIAGAAPISQQGLLAKIRYRQTSQACHVSGSEGEYTVHFEQAQRAITPGQYVVFYQQGSCLGGGVIVAGE